VLGDRRDHFESTKDVGKFSGVSEERKRREIDPTLRSHECVQELKTGACRGRLTRERLERPARFMTIMSGLFEEILRMPMGRVTGRGQVARARSSRHRQREKKAVDAQPCL